MEMPNVEALRNEYPLRADFFHASMTDAKKGAALGPDVCDDAGELLYPVFSGILWGYYAWDDCESAARRDCGLLSGHILQRLADHPSRLKRACI